MNEYCSSQGKKVIQNTSQSRRSIPYTVSANNTKNRNSIPHSHFYRPQTKFAKVMFSQVSVCPQVGSQSLSKGVSIWGVCLGGGGLCPGGLCLGCLCLGVSLSRRGSVHRVSVRETPRRETPLYDNKWAVRILLECIFILFNGSQCTLNVSTAHFWMSFLNQ